jgi:Kef-type K+ transport system membrane component KefB
MVAAANILRLNIDTTSRVDGSGFRCRAPFSPDAEHAGIIAVRSAKASLPGPGAKRLGRSSLLAHTAPHNEEAAGAVETFLQILLLLLTARALGEGAVRLNFPASIGELAAGVALALALALFGDAVPFLGRLVASATLDTIAQLGIFFLVLLAGIEMKPAEIAQASRGAFAVALGGMLLPLATGIGLGWLVLPDSDLKVALALVIGVSMAITAIPATAKILSELGLLHTPLGRMVISAAVFDDVLSLFLLAGLTALIETGHFPEPAALAWLLAKIAAFFGITIGIGVHLYPRISRRIGVMDAAALELSAIIALGLGYGWLAQALGMHWIMGAFMAGLYFEESRVGAGAYEDLRLIVGTLTAGLLGPMFFAWIGLQVDLGAVVAVPGLLLALIAIAFLGKLIGAGVPALWLGLGRREALTVGIGMSARGVMELVVLSIVLEAGLFERADAGHAVTGHLFSALVIMAMVTTLMVPLALRALLGPKPPSGPAPP